MERRCAVCGILFSGRKSTAKVCSLTCQLAFKRDARKERKIAKKVGATGVVGKMLSEEDVRAMFQQGINQ